MTPLRSGVKLTLMKKLLGIIVLGILLSNNVEAKPDWSKCDKDEFYKPLYCYGPDGKLLSKSERKKVKKEEIITVYDEESWKIPSSKSPNKATLIYYHFKYLHGSPKMNYEIQPSENPYEFKSDLREDKYVKKEMQKKAILSYLFFEGDKIVIDEKSPKEKFGEFIDDQTKLRSMSVGKSLISYVLGHAICGGYIDSVDQRIDDWDLVKNTLYDGQKLIDLLNMAAGDQKYVYDSYFLSNPSVVTHLQIADDANLAYYMTTQFQGTKKSKSKYNYNIINTNLIFNYILFKSGDDFEKILDETFKNKARIKNSVYFYKLGGHKDDGIANAMFYATRYDYLRIAKAIADDYQNNTCVGKYLKEIYDRKIPKNINHDGDKSEPLFNRTYSYGGQFHLDYPGLKKRIVFGMGGYGGQAILIDVENSRIVVVNSIHYNNTKYKYNHKKLLINPIKLGKKSFKK